MKAHRHMKWALPAMLLLIVAATGAAYAAEGEVTIGTQWWYQHDREPKYFDEYRDISNGPFVDEFVILDKIDGGRYAIFGEHALKRDQSTTALYRRPRWTVGVRYQEIPHNLSYVSRTPYFEASPGYFALPDVIQRTIQTDSTNAQRTADLRDLTANSRLYPLGFRTDVMRGQLKGRLGQGLSLDVRGSRRERNGSKTYSMTLGGFSNVVEIPEPIDQEILSGEARLSYLRHHVALEVSGGLERFDNAIDALIVDNPRQATDIAAASSRGRIDLYPDNHTARGALRAGIDLPHNSTLNAYAGIMETRQNDRWLPYTINTALPVDSLPGTGTEGKALVYTQDYRLHSSPSRYVTGTLRFRRNDYENKTPVHIFPVEVLYDVSRSVGDVEADPFQYANTTYGADLDLTPVSRLVIGGTAEHIRTTRTLREITGDKEWAFEGHVNYHPSVHGLVLEGRFRHGNRKLDEFHIEHIVEDGDTIDQPNLRRFDVGDRIQNRGRLRAGFQPNDRSQISLDYEYLRNLYDDRGLAGGIGALVSPIDTVGQLGLLDETQHVLGADVTYDLTKRASLHAGLGYSKLYTNQRSRTSPATVTLVTDSTWMARIYDRFVYGNAGFDWHSANDRLSFGANWELERAPTSYRLTSVGLRPRAQDLPSTKYRHQSVGVESWYALDKTGKTSLGARWRWDEFSANDFAFTNIPLLIPTTVAANSTPTEITMADNFRGYRAHIVALMFKRAF
ncbi:MAG: MtrB/PioB family outer membrane beta-barrel protein [Bacteroidota bacterium]